MTTTETIITEEAEALAVVVYRDLQEAQSADLMRSPAGIVAEVQAAAAAAGTVSALILGAARSLVVDSAETYTEGLDLVRRAKESGKEADSARKSYTDVLGKVVKWINDQYRPAISDAAGPGTGAVSVAWAKCQAYEREQQRIADEAARKAREEQERIERKAREEAEAARRAEEEALRKAEEARKAGDEAAAKAAEQEAARKAAIAERREEKAEIAAAAPIFIPPATTGARKAAGLSKSRELPTWEYDGPDEEACILRVAKQAAAGNVAALKCLTINGTAALLQAKAGQLVGGLRFGKKAAAPGVRGK